MFNDKLKLILHIPCINLILSPCFTKCIWYSYSINFEAFVESNYNLCISVNWLGL